MRRLLVMYVTAWPPHYRTIENRCGGGVCYDAAANDLQDDVQRLSGVTTTL
jgi:hypothetical protein